MIMATDLGQQRIRSKPATRLLALLILPLLTLLTANSVALAQEELHIVVFGDSLTAGFGLPADAAFPAQLAVALKHKGHNIRITNAGVSGDTTSGGLARFDWAVPQDADAVILELGANDALRGVSPKIARSNLDTILSRLKQRSVPVLIAGMRAPANWGADYVKKFNAMFGELATKYQSLHYPFFMEGVIDQPKLKLADALHPNQAGVAEIVRRILPLVEQLLQRASAR